ncbi:MAG: acetyl esterase [Chloroflexota bacterium]|nr:acetyl esterase [Chloroflexota bacterium]
MFEPAAFASLFRAEAVDPETIAVNAQLAAGTARAPQVYREGAPAVRAVRRQQALASPSIPSPMAVERAIPGPDGPIPVRMFVPPTVHGVYLHIHGGGYCLGEPLSSDPRNEAVARGCEVAVVSVDYRLAPEHPYPAGADDCEAVARWLVEHASSEFGADRLLVGGESAGATLSVGTLLRLRDRHGYRGCAGANLMYGWYDLLGTPSITRIGQDSPTLSPESLIWFAAHYLPDRARWHEPDVSPLFADLAGLPPALFSVGTLDPLLDDSLFMYARWAAACNATELAIYPGGAHGLSGHPSQLGAQANERADRFLRDCLEGD